MADEHQFIHPHDTPASAGLRFLGELLAWVAGPWAVSMVSNWLVLPALVLLLVLPGVFSTPGDKRKVIVATPGCLRVLIELFLYTVAALAPWFVWPQPLALACNLVVVLSLILGATRLRWLCTVAGVNRANQSD